jgi:hypothetical protein
MSPRLRGIFLPIRPEVREQFGTWPCPFCGAHNYPEECTEDGCQVRGVCSACGKVWEEKVDKAVKVPNE